MRRSRWLILAATLLAVFLVAANFIRLRETNRQNAPAAPPQLESGVEGRANDWVYTQSDGDRPRVTIRAKSFKQIQAPWVMQLEGVQLELYKKDGKHFDLVKSATAQFDISAKTLYAPGDVEIEMGEAVEGQPPGRVLNIRSSGVRFASDTGKATTDQAASFQFDLGGGSASGIEYDPQSRELHLRSHVALDWKGKDSQAKAMHVEAGEAFYYESKSNVILRPNAKLTRDTLQMETGEALITLDGGEITRVDAQGAQGLLADPNRRVQFAADHLLLNFGDNMTIQNMKGERNGRLVSTANFLRTTVTADVLDMGFKPAAENPKESVLMSAIATGKSVVEAVPLARPGELLADTRVMKSDVIRMKMREGGRDIDNVETDGPGIVEFLPNRVGQPRRSMKGDRIWLAYGPENRVQSFRSLNVTTRTEKPPADRLGHAPPPPPMLTSSKEILALFDPKTSELARLEQKTDFRYQEGTRQATADQATLEEAKDLITLTGSARTWDPTGSASSDRLTMNQRTGDTVAEGHVATTRLPDQKPEQKADSSSALLSNTEVMQGRAQRMTSADKNQKLHYEGNAVVWQGANRVEGDRIDIDRMAQVLEAHGKVVSQLADKSKEAAVPKTAPIFTVVHAPDLIYTGGETRLAKYTGGVVMNRPDLNVASKEMRAWLNQSGSDNSLDKAFADGQVKIVSSALKRTRTGTSDHSEYYASEQKVILAEGDPLMVDSLKGRTRGRQLTWWANNDRLLVDGVENRPADSLIKKK